MEADSILFIGLVKRTTMPIEPIKRAQLPQVLPDGSASRAAGLASVYKISIIPYGRRFPAATRLSSTLSSDRRELAEVLLQGLQMPTRAVLL